MTDCPLSLCGAALVARPSGALWWPEERLMAVSDLHFGKSERVARRGGGLLPPYEVAETLDRLQAEIDRLGPRSVLCLGDSFDDLTVGEGLVTAARDRLTALMAGRSWVWIAGNHDPGPLDLGGTHQAEVRRGPLLFRHIAEPGGLGEVSGHWHPKARVSLGGRSLSRPCFLADTARIILPAFGTYTGGLSLRHDALRGLMGPGARAILTGAAAISLPMAALTGEGRA